MRDITKEQKATAVLAMLMEKETPREAADRLGVDVGTVDRWRAQYLRNVTAGFKDDRSTALRAIGRRPFLTAAVALSAAFGIFMATEVVSQQTVDCPGDFPLFCFTPNTPARASDVNSNFVSLFNWLEAKVGAVEDSGIQTGDLSATNVSVTGNATMGFADIGEAVMGSADIADGATIAGTATMDSAAVTGTVAAENLTLKGSIRAGTSAEVLYDIDVKRRIYDAPYTTSSYTRSTTPIPDDELMALCGDEDGCRITLVMRFIQAGREGEDASVGPLHFRIDPDTLRFRAAEQNGGRDDDSTTFHALRAWDCYLTDGEYTVGSSSNSDAVRGMHLLNYANDYTASCRLIIDD